MQGKVLLPVTRWKEKESNGWRGLTMWEYENVEMCKLCTLNLEPGTWNLKLETCNLFKAACVKQKSEPIFKI